MLSNFTHLLTVHCTPGTENAAWNCGEMAVKQPGLASSPPCQSGSQIIYAWAMDAPALELPEDVGFRVGADTDIAYLVLQVSKDTRHKLDTIVSNCTGSLRQCGLH